MSSTPLIRAAAAATASPAARASFAAARRPLLASPLHSPTPKTAAADGQQRRRGHTVRIILADDLPGGRGYRGDVEEVRAGYARNYLVPKKLALYATPQNFERLGIADPDAETLQEKREREAAERAAEEDEEAAADLRAADLLRSYLSNKVLRIWRNVDPSTGAVHPGSVDRDHVRAKLSSQLRIDLGDHETVQLRAEPVVGHAELDQEGEAGMDKLMEEIGSPDGGGGSGSGDTDADGGAKIRQLGEFIAKITLRGDHVVPLKFAVLKR